MNGSTPTLIIAVVAGYLLGAVSSGTLSDYFAIGAASTGLFLGVLRYVAVLRGGTRDEIERASAIGFIAGFVFGMVTVAYLVAV